MLASHLSLLCACGAAVGDEGGGEGVHVHADNKHTHTPPPLLHHLPLFPLAVACASTTVCTRSLASHSLPCNGCRRRRLSAIWKAMGVEPAGKRAVGDQGVSCSETFISAVHQEQLDQQKPTEKIRKNNQNVRSRWRQTPRDERSHACGQEQRKRDCELL